MGGEFVERSKRPSPLVQRRVGFSLREVQQGLKPAHAKPLQGFGGASVLEITVDFDSDTYRAVYAVQFEEAVYVLHCFMKKSSQGIRTPARDMELIELRFKQAKRAHITWLREKKEHQ